MISLTEEQREKLKIALQNQLAGYSADTDDKLAFKHLLGILSAYK
ncbi:hypothetical protein SATMO3_21480 [Sporomusa aerivorans]